MRISCVAISFGQLTLHLLWEAYRSRPEPIVPLGAAQSWVTSSVDSEIVREGMTFSFLTCKGRAITEPVENRELDDLFLYNPFGGALALEVVFSCSELEASRHKGYEGDLSRLWLP